MKTNGSLIADPNGNGNIGTLISSDYGPLAIERVQNWAKGVDLWNLALDPSGQPNNGNGCGGCSGIVTVNQSTGAVGYPIDYYELGQLSKFVPPGSVHIGSAAGVDGVETAAFRAPGGTEVLVAHNTGGSANTFTTTWNKQGSFSYTLPAGATVTFVSAGPAAPITSTAYQLVNRASGKVLDIAGGSTSDGALAVQETGAMRSASSGPRSAWAAAGTG
jgi:glucosylceramidase